MKRIVIGAVTVALAAAACIWALRPKPEDEVIQQLSALSTLVRKAADEKQMESLVKAKRITELFDSTCTLTMKDNPLSGTYTPTEMGALALKLRERFSKVAVVFGDPAVTFPTDKTADVVMVTTIKGVTETGKVNEVLESQCRLCSVEGDWLFTEFTAIESLKK